MHRISQDALRPQLVPFLATRLIFTGVGGFNPLSQGLEFTLSPRMAYFRLLVTQSSTSERGIWHEKSESLCSGYKRLHVLCGESLCSETANFLKVGATALLVAMADEGLTPGNAVQLADPVAALQTVAGDVTCKTPLKMADGGYLTAIDIQRHYLEQAEACIGFGFMPEWAPEVCRQWRAIIRDLDQGSDAVAQKLDWGIKLALYANHARSMGVRWDELARLNSVIDQVGKVLDAREYPDRPIPIERAIGLKRPIFKQVAALEPLLDSRGLGWEDLRVLLKSRQKFFEIDTRFGQLGPKGIFHSLDLTGMLDHKVSGVDNIEHAVAEPPSIGRARVRGEVIQRLAGTGNVQCDWQQVIDYGERQILDLSDPFTQEESWHPLGRGGGRDARFAHGLADLLTFDVDHGSTDESSQYSRRVAALNCYMSGNYREAEEVLRRLVEEGYEVASNRCHLARSLVLLDRSEEARREIDLAMDDLSNACSYVFPRILFFEWLFAILDGADCASVAAQMKAALRETSAHSEWTIQPMLDYLRPRLGESNFHFLKALAEALSSARAIPRIDEFPQWSDTARSPDFPRAMTRV
jgi:hypothetical protein